MNVLEKALSPLTTASTVGVATRYLTVMVGAGLAVAGALGYLSEDQQAVISSNADAFISAASALVASAVTIYAIATKSRSDKADSVAKQIDEKIAPSTTVRIETPPGQPDIVVPGEKK